MQIEHPDFKQFLAYCSWLKQEMKDASISKDQLKLNKDFVDHFPKLTKLLQQASVIKITTQNKSYHLLSWTTAEGSSCGWLIKKEKNKRDLNFIKEHLILSSVIGSLVETYNVGNGMITNSQPNMFDKAKCFEGIGSIWKEYYQDRCKKENFLPLDLSSSITFAIEAGGHYTLYDTKTTKVFMFNTDPGLLYIEEFGNQPDVTFFRIKGALIFQDYVEKIAQEWLDHICVEY